MARTKLTPQIAHSLAVRLYAASGQCDTRLESAIAQDAVYAYRYAFSVLKSPFPEAEPVIAQNPEWAYRYAMNVLQGPFPEAEAVIAQNGYWAMRYATAVLGLLTFDEINRWKGKYLD